MSFAGVSDVQFSVSTVDVQRYVTAGQSIILAVSYAVAYHAASATFQKDRRNRSRTSAYLHSAVASKHAPAFFFSCNDCLSPPPLPLRQPSSPVRSKSIPNPRN